MNDNYEKLENFERDFRISAEKNKLLLKYAGLCRRCGLLKAEATMRMEQFYASCSDPRKNVEHEKEIERAVEKVYSQVWTSGKKQIQEEIVSANPLKAWREKQGSSKWLQSEVDAFDKDPIAVNALEVVRAWHKSQDVVAWSANKVNDISNDTFQDISTRCNTSLRNRITLNPLAWTSDKSIEGTRIEREGKFIWRSDAYVSGVDAVLIEIDRPIGNDDAPKSLLTKEEKERIWEDTKLLLEKLNIKPTSITYSGNKSYHCVVRLKEQIKPDEWKGKYQKRVSDLLDAIGADGQMATLSRATRTPFVVTPKSNLYLSRNERQRCIYFNPQAEISIDEYVEKLEGLANEMHGGKKGGGVVEEAIASKCAPDLTQANFEEFLKFHGIKIEYDLATNKLLFSENGIGKNLRYAQVESFLRDKWSTTFANKKGKRLLPIQYILKEKLDVHILEHEFNSVDKWLSSLKWDGVDRIGDVCECLHLSETDFRRTLVHKWLVQTAALPSNKGELETAGVLSLVGRQGTYKTTFFKLLVPEQFRGDWFSEGRELNPDDKDSKIALMSGWICELGELDSTMRREQSALKAFITNTVIDVRKPYEREASKVAKCVSLCSTCNATQCLRDDENRRWWTIDIGETPIDTDKMAKLDISQLWAQARKEWNDWMASPSKSQLTKPYCLTRDEMAKLADINAMNKTIDVLEEELKSAFDFSKPGQKWMRAKEIWRIIYPDFAFDITKHRQILMSITRILGQNGIKTQPSNGNSHEYFMPPINTKDDVENDVNPSGSRGMPF